MYYIKNMNFWLDLQIVLDTVKVTLCGLGARQQPGEIAQILVSEKNLAGKLKRM